MQNRKPLIDDRGDVDAAVSVEVSGNSSCTKSNTIDRFAERKISSSIVPAEVGQAFPFFGLNLYEGIHVAVAVEVRHQDEWQRYGNHGDVEIMFRKSPCAIV